MATGIRYKRSLNGQIWRYYEVGTGQTVDVRAPLYFKEDFLGQDVTQATAAPGSPWDLRVGTGTCAVAADGVGGRLTLSTGGTTQDYYALLDFGGHENFSIFDASGDPTGLQFEAGLIFTNGETTKTTVPTGVKLGVGMTSDDIALNSNEIWSYAAARAGFTIDETFALTLDTDDGTNTGSAASGVSLVHGVAATGTFKIARIDFTTPADVKFYLDGVRVGAGTTFDMSTAAVSSLQPAFTVWNTSTANTAASTLTIGRVKIWQRHY